MDPNHINSYGSDGRLFRRHKCFNFAMLENLDLGGLGETGGPGDHAKRPSAKTHKTSTFSNLAKKQRIRHLGAGPDEGSNFVAGEA
jgi:hypothetical protein